MVNFMHRVVSYVFGWLFAIVLTLMMWNIFIKEQPRLYEIMDSALSNEWNKDTGNNGQLVNSIRDKVWNADTKNETLIAYVER